jgi:hypothetical protein
MYIAFQFHVDRSVTKIEAMLKITMLLPTTTSKRLWNGNMNCEKSKTLYSVKADSECEPNLAE